jgi:hypothetical protein
LHCKTKSTKTSNSNPKYQPFPQIYQFSNLFWSRIWVIGYFCHCSCITSKSRGSASKVFQKAQPNFRPLVFRGILYPRVAQQTKKQKPNKKQPIHPERIFVRSASNANVRVFPCAMYKIPAKEAQYYYGVLNFAAQT